jgi:hypothetical protein
LSQLDFWIETLENDFGIFEGTLKISPPLPSPEGEIYVRGRCTFGAKRGS